MCMLHFFIENAQKLPPFAVLNFEHGLRGKESNEDSAFVSAFCAERGIQCDVVRLKCKDFCKRHGYGVEQGARILRRREFERIVKCGLADRVLTAHHADWAEGFAPKYQLTADNALGVVEKETGLVFAQVLEDAGVYKRTPEGKAAFLRFLEQV